MSAMHFLDDAERDYLTISPAADLLGQSCPYPEVA
jgi:hypothetical protein